MIAIKLQPKLWERCKKRSVRDFGGKFSARAMQHAVKCYKKKCGGVCYKGRKSRSNSMSKWTKEEWTTESGKPSMGKLRYLPKKSWSILSKSERRRTNRSKRMGKSQWVKQPKDIGTN